jgi:hypothetical protein
VVTAPSLKVRQGTRISACNIIARASGSHHIMQRTFQPYLLISSIFLHKAETSGQADFRPGSESRVPGRARAGPPWPGRGVCRAASGRPELELGTPAAVLNFSTLPPLSSHPRARGRRRGAAAAAAAASGAAPAAVAPRRRRRHPLVFRRCCKYCNRCDGRRPPVTAGRPLPCSCRQWPEAARPAGACGG